MGDAEEDRSTTGEIKSVSWLAPTPRKSLSMMAKLPVPPVRLPRCPGSSATHTPPLAMLSVTVHDDRIVVVSKCSERPVNAAWYPGAVHALATVTLTFLVAFADPRVTETVLGW